MTTLSTYEQSNTLVDQAAASADHAIKSTQRVTNETLDSLSESVQGMRNQAAPMLNRTGEQISALTQRGVDAVRDSSQQLRAQALRASDATVGYIKHEPVKAVLIAAVTGAALLALLGLVRGARRN